MPRTWSPHSTRQPWPAWVLVGLLHLALLLSLWQLPVWADRIGTPARQPPLVLTLWPQVREPTSAPPPASKPAPAPRIAPLPLRKEPEAITLPSEPAVAAPSDTETGPRPERSTPGPATATAPPAPLNLTLPRGASAPWRQRNPALRGRYPWSTPPLAIGIAIRSTPAIARMSRSMASHTNRIFRPPKGRT